MTKLEQVRAKIIEAVPEIVVNPYAQLIGYDRKITYFAETRFITLADVLRTVNSSIGPRIAINDDGQFMEWHDEGYGYLRNMWAGTTVVWNLSVSLNEQALEVIEFLHKILCT